MRLLYMYIGMTSAAYRCSDIVQLNGWIDGPRYLLPLLGVVVYGSFALYNAWNLGHETCGWPRDPV